MRKIPFFLGQAQKRELCKKQREHLIHFYFYTLKKIALHIQNHIFWGIEKIMNRS